jgi:O-antigen ligase
LAFLAILLDGGRSTTIAYTLFINIVSLAYCYIRWQLLWTYIASWLAYLLVTYVAGFAIGASTLRIARETSSGRFDLWVNALQCWAQHPVIGCGLYQLQQYPHLSAHPHNLFIQVLSETGLLSFGLLFYILYAVTKCIDWSQLHRYFIVAALLAISSDLFFQVRMFIL